MKKLIGILAASLFLACGGDSSVSGNSEIEATPVYINTGHAVPNPNFGLTDASGWTDRREFLPVYLYQCGNGTQVRNTWDGNGNGTIICDWACAWVWNGEIGAKAKYHYHTVAEYTDWNVVLTGIFADCQQ